MNLRPRKHFTTLALVLTLGCYLASPLRTVQSQERKDKGQKSDRKEPQKGQSDAVVRLETELVQIDVIVTDKQGRIVRDLKREDFELIEDGKPQTISYFSSGTAAQPAITPRKKETNATLQAPEPGPGRYLVLAVDDLHLAPGNLMQAKEALNRFVERQMGAGDQVAIVNTSGRLGLFQQFTTQREILRRAINRLSAQERVAATTIDIPRITPYQAELIDQGDPEALELAVIQLIRQLQMEREVAVAEARGKARMITAQNTSVTVSTLSTLDQVIRSLKPLPGRKVIILISDGFLLGSFRDGRHFDVRRITDAATRAGVTIYTIDARGLVAIPVTMDASQSTNDPIALMGVRARIENSSIEAQRDGLNALARDTGGLPVFNNNDLNLGLQRVLDDTEAYYLLAFEPDTSYRDGRFRKLEVRIPSRPDLRLRSRKGYFAPDDKAAEKEAREKIRPAEKGKEKPPEQAAKETLAANQNLIREGIGSLFPLRGIPMRMTAGFIKLPEGGPAADIALHLDASALKFDLAGGRNRVTLLLTGMIFDENGKTASRFDDRIDLHLRPTTLETTLKNGIVYSKFAKLDPGLYQIRAVIREEGKIQLGSANCWIEIPDLSKNQLTLSSIFFSDGGEDLDLSASIQKIRKNINGITESQLPAKVYRRFKRDSKFDFLIFTYNAQKNSRGSTDLAVQSQVHSEGKVLLATPIRRINDQNAPGLKKGSDQTGVPYLARLSLESFKPGDYELRMIVIDRNAKTSAKGSINFTVE